jgi:hypothetical protein
LRRFRRFRRFRGLNAARLNGLRPVACYAVELRSPLPDCLHSKT